MAIHRMRTVQEALEEIHKADAGSAVTANCIRTLCKKDRFDVFTPVRKSLWIWTIC